MPVSAGYKVNDLTELKALTTSDKITGYARLVASIPAWFSYNSSSTATGDDIDIITPNSGSGRWLRAPKTPIASDIASLSEYIDDRVATLLQQGSNITISYDDSANTLTIAASATSYTDEQAQDAIGAALTDSSTVNLEYVDGSNQITASIIAGSIVDSLIASDAAIAQTKINGLTSSLGGKSDVGHTHTSSDISGFGEAVQDVIGSFLIQGSNITLDYNDVSNTLTISSSGSSGGGLGNWDDLYGADSSNWDSEY
jgi:hypothetical protein